MKTLKKSLCIVLSFLMVFSTVVFFNPIKADAINVSEFTSGDYYYYPEGTKFISDIKIEQGVYDDAGGTCADADSRKEVINNTSSALINAGYTILGGYDAADGKTAMTGNLTQRKDDAKNWGTFTFLGYKTTTDITQAYATSIRARHENNSGAWTVGGATHTVITAVDLNKGVGGDTIFLYRSNDASLGLPITELAIYNSANDTTADKSTMFGTTFQTVLDGSGNVSDLKKNASGCNYAYMGYGNYNIYEKIPEATMKALYDQIARGDAIGTANLEKFKAQDEAAYNNAIAKYTAATTVYNAFNNAYKAATYNEQDVKDATAELKAALDALYIAVDYASLNAKIAEADAYIDNGENYTNESINALNKALNNAILEEKDFTLASYTSAATLIAEAEAENAKIATLVAAMEDAILELATEITFDAAENGGTTSASTVTIVCGRNNTVTVNLAGYTASKDGYDFVGWSTDPDATTGVTTSLTVALGGSVYAIFKVSEYTLVLEGNGATEGSYTPSTHEFNKSFTLPTGVFKKTGYRVLGWSKDPNAEKATWTNGASVQNLASVSGETVTLYVVWTPIKYTVVYDGNGAQGSMANQSLTYDTPANLRTNTFTKEGAVFLGWSTSADGEVIYTDAQEVKNLSATNNSKVTLYAIWDTSSYTVEFKGNGATEGTDSSVTVDYADAFTLPTDAEFKKTGYNLLGWATSSDATAAEYAPGAQLSKLSADDGAVITLYAVWEKAVYTVTFVTAKGESISASYEYGDTLVVPENTAADYDDDYHYTYAWPTVETTVTGSATYTEISYPVAHNFSIFVERVEANCIDDGYEKYACECGAEKLTVLPSPGHSYVGTVTPPTCTEQGYTTYVCSVCDDTYVDNYVAALGHTPGAVVKENVKLEDCGNDGYYENVVYCTVCDEELSRTPVVVPATGNHSWGEGVVTDPTCTEPGGTKYVCTVCSDVKYDDPVDPIGHNWAATTYVFAEDGSACTATRICQNDTSHVETVEAVITSVEKTAPTCTVDGWTTYTATFDEDWAKTQIKDIQDIPAIQHNWAATTYVFAEDGSACTAQRVCMNDAKHVETANAIIDIKIKVPATCTEDGTTTYTATFEEDWAETQVKDIVDIDALGHTAAEAVQENIVESTCTEKGSYDEVVYCSVCGEELSRVKVTTVKLGHDWGETTYSWSEDGKACTAQRVCKRVEDHVETIEAVVSSEVHVDPTCTEKGSATYTAQFAKDWAETQTTSRMDVAPLGHRSDKIVKENLVPATCNTPGSYTAVSNCVACSIEISREDIVIPATGEHINGTAVKENEVIGNCGEEGSYDSVVYCTVCNSEVSRKTYTTLATGKHTPGEEQSIDYVQPTCGEDGSYKVVVHCTVCDMELSRKTEVLAATGAHTEGAAVIENEQEPNCGKIGCYDEVVYCSVCSKELRRETKVVPALGGHTAGNAVEENRVEPTCAEVGTYELVTYCTVCSDEISRVEVEIPATGIHTEGEAVKEYVVEPTCFDAGSYKMVTYCSVCNEVISESEVKTEAALGHDFSIFLSSTEGTCIKPSTMTHKCVRCDETQTVEGTFGNHSAKASKKENVVASTCTELGSYDMVVRCRYCDDILSTKHYTEASLGHKFTIRVERIAGDCQTVSSTTYKCVHCDLTDTQYGNYGAHKKAERHENIVDATCSSSGSYDKIIYCTVCDEVLSEKEVKVAKLPHTASEPVVENEIAATATQGGSYEEVEYCEDCGEELRRVTVRTPALGTGDDNTDTDNNTGSDDSDSGSSSGSGMFSWWDKLVRFFKSLLSIFG